MASQFDATFASECKLSSCTVTPDFNRSVGTRLRDAQPSALKGHGIATKTPSLMGWPAITLLLLILAVMAVTSVFTAIPVFADNGSSSCVIGDVHVSSITPTGYSSTMVQVTTSFSVYCSNGVQGTIWNIQTKVYAESNLLGITPVASSENRYSMGQGTQQYVVNSQFDAMSYYGYADQTPSFYVQITVINHSTGSLDAQQQVPFAVDTSQYPFTLTQPNYCKFPGLSQFFQLLPGCGGSSGNGATNTSTTPNNCATYGLPQFLEPYLPGCSGTGNTTPSNQSANQQPAVQYPGNQVTPNTPTTPQANTPSSGLDSRSIEVLSAIAIAALASCLSAALIAQQATRLRAFYDRIGRKRFCARCGTRLEPNAAYCYCCGEAWPEDPDKLTFWV